MNDRPDLFAHTRRLRQRLLDTRPPDRTPATTADVRRVVVILTAPRGGSSLLAELLRSTEQTLSLYGQHEPWYQLYGLRFPLHGLTSDSFASLDGPPAGFAQRFSLDLMACLGVGGPLHGFSAPDYADQLALHLPLQWPHLALAAEGWRVIIDRALTRYRNVHRDWNTGGFFLTLVREMRREFPSVNPYYYDLPYQAVRHAFPDCPRPSGPPNPICVIEHPPFVPLRPRRSPTREEVRDKPLVLKTTVDAHHPLLLTELFPNAAFRFIHLTRNPCASINGLCDGWNDRGFFSHNLEGHAELAIAGYSDRGEWGHTWWSFTLPPGWEELTRRPLEYVCGHQWHTAHQDALRALSQLDPATWFRMKFEHLIGPREERMAVFRRLLSFLSLSLDEGLRAALREMPVKNASVAPARGRWRRRRKQLWPVVTQAHVTDTSEKLGYPLAESDTWP